MSKFMIYRNALKAVSRFQSVKDVRFYLNGVCIEWNALQTRMIATDGHALIVHKSDAKDDNAGAGSIIIPADAVKTMLAWKPENKWQKDQPIMVEQSANGEFRASWHNNLTLFRPIDGQFPNYRRVMPVTVTGAADFYDAEFLIRTKRASEDLGSDNGRFELSYNGAVPDENGQTGASGPGIAVINDSCFVIIMPMRQGPADLAATNWGREDLPVDAPAELAQTESEVPA